MYRAQRNYENVQRMLFDGVGRYDIPEIEPKQFDNAEFIGSIMQRVPRTARIKQYISFWTTTSSIGYGLIRTNIFLCCRGLSMC